MDVICSHSLLNVMVHRELAAGVGLLSCWRRSWTVYIRMTRSFQPCNSTNVRRDSHDWLRTLHPHLRSRSQTLAYPRTPLAKNGHILHVQ